MNAFRLLAACATFAAAAAAFAQSTLPTIDGEVRKIDAAAGKITLRHGDITNLDMPAMTMVFRVKDPALLEKVKPGDKVRFTVDQPGGTLTVMSLEPAN